MMSDSILAPFIPYRTDFLARFFMYTCQGNPVYVALLYFLLSTGGLYLLGWLTGQLKGKNGLPPMYTNIVDNLNIGLLAPIGAGLLCQLYKCITHAVAYIETNPIISDSSARDLQHLLGRIDTLYNGYAPIVLALFISLAINVFTFFAKKTSWLSYKAGITGVYGRLIVILNFFMIALVLYKCAVTTWFLNHLFSLDIIIQPMHPDRSGGLKPIGDLAVTMTYFILLLIVYVSMLVVFDRFAVRKKGFILIFIFLYLAAPVLLFLPLSGAHGKMVEAKSREMQFIDELYQREYSNFKACAQDNELAALEATNLLNIGQLYAKAQELPEWPFDIGSMLRMFSVFVLPVGIFLFEQVMSRDSLLREWLLRRIKSRETVA
ncbi:MAG: hypothetical protein KA184_12275 [Candidatus Hydrogenedentes bacterium]|nr:hypothetical protein [Candidatus Hydrogenedentota bacterium]